MFKFKWFAVVAALALMVLVAGCASQAGSEPSTPDQGAGQVAPAPSVAPETGVEPTTEAPAVSESPLATPVVEATTAVTSTGAVADTPEAPAMEMPEQSEEVQGWAVLWDPEIGFELRYPEGWLVGEAEVTDKDAPVTRVYTLEPADWDEEWTPILVEASEGSEEDFRRIYSEPAESEDRTIGPLTYAYESAGKEGSIENFAVFQDPENPDLRVVVRDVLTGFPDRAAAHGDAGPLVEQVIESFRWRK